MRKRTFSSKEAFSDGGAKVGGNMAKKKSRQVYLIDSTNKKINSQVELTSTAKIVVNNDCLCVCRCVFVLYRVYSVLWPVTKYSASPRC